jgi:HAD superfamily hydrolase (TIGR01509 family)
MTSIKAIFFDLDGVLVDSKRLHFETFRDALQKVRPDLELSWTTHEAQMDGLSTKLKLKALVDQGKLLSYEAEKVLELKQRLTDERLPKAIQPRDSLLVLLNTLRNRGLRLFCCSNSIQRTVSKSLTLLGISSVFEKVYSNEDVPNPKPSPDIYLLALQESGLQASEVLILEDSNYGKQAAYASGAHVLEIEDVQDVTHSLLRETLYSLEKVGRVVPRSLRSVKPISYNIVVPLDDDFVSMKSHRAPNCFQEVCGKPFLHWIVQSLIPKDTPTDHYELRFHFVFRSSRITSMMTDKLFWDVSPNIYYFEHRSLVPTLSLLQCLLLAEEQINSGDPVLIVNPAVWVDWSPDSFYRALLNPEYDGVLLTTDAGSATASVQVSSEFAVLGFSDSRDASPYRLAGIYGWRFGSDFVHYATQILGKYPKGASDGYVWPAYREALPDGKAFRVKGCRRILSASEYASENSNEPSK